VYSGQARSHSSLSQKRIEAFSTSLSGPAYAPEPSYGDQLPRTVLSTVPETVPKTVPKTVPSAPSGYERFLSAYERKPAQHRAFSWALPLTGRWASLIREADKREVGRSNRPRPTALSEAPAADYVDGGFAVLPNFSGWVSKWVSKVGRIPLTLTLPRRRDSASAWPAPPAACRLKFRGGCAVSSAACRMRVTV
jgi:hypothetical protein